MAKVILGTNMSLDGYINDRSGSVQPLYPDFDAMREAETLQESVRDTGAVIMGRKTFNMADDPDDYANSYEYQVPIFVLTHHPPNRKPKENNRLTITFVTDGIESAVTQAKAAAGDKDVTIIGTPDIARQVIRAGLADELHVDIMPLLLGGGLRFFEDIGLQPMQLEKIKTLDLPLDSTHLRYRFNK